MKSFTSFAAILAAASASRASSRDSHFDLDAYDSGFYGGYDAQPVVVTPVVLDEDDHHHHHVHHHHDDDEFHEV